MQVVKTDKLTFARRRQSSKYDQIFEALDKLKPGQSALCAPDDKLKTKDDPDGTRVYAARLSSALRNWQARTEDERYFSIRKTSDGKVAISRLEDPE